MKTSSSVVIFFIVFTFFIPSILIGLFLYWSYTKSKESTESTETPKVIKFSTARVETDMMKMISMQPSEDLDDPVSVNIKHIEFPSIETTMHFKNMMIKSETTNVDDNKWNYNNKEKTLKYNYSEEDEDEDEYNYNKYIARNNYNKNMSSIVSDYDSYDY
jgi:hypothetical protein